MIGWMREAGMQAGFDAAGNVVGRYDGTMPGTPALMLGSHLDSVRDGGRFDGPLGVVAGLAVVERLARAKRRLPFPIEVIGFADEEGARFGGAVLGSAAVAGNAPANWRERRDANGVAAEAAVRDYGVDPDGIEAASRRTDPPFAYLELHIEQGPALDATNTPLGCVTGIAGATRARITVEGEAGHAGTVPMTLRRDALAAAAECVLAVEGIVGGTGAVATVGAIEAHPNAGNVIPGRTTFWLDLRALNDALHHTLRDRIWEAFNAIAKRRGVTITREVTNDTRATPCAPHLVATIRAVLNERDPAAPLLPSGAGHDGLNMAAVTDIAMIFVRCRGGVSHHPDESMTLADLAASLDALYDVCLRLAAERAS